MDIKLDADGDIELENGDLVLTDDIVQEIQIMLKWVLSEWRYGTHMGMKMFNGIKNPNLDEIENYITAYIEQSDKVYVADVYAELDNETRKLTVNFDAVTSNGDIDGEVDIYG